jgi:hypothetical protein
MAVALGGLGLVVAAHGSEPHQKDAVTVESSASASGQGSVVAGGGDGPSGTGGSTLTGLGGNLQGVVNDPSIRLLDFGDIDQSGKACAGGPVTAPKVISVRQGESAVLDSDHVVQLKVDGDVVYGDVDGDGRDEAVVHTVCAFGANGAIDNIEVWDLDTGVAVAKTSVGEPPESLTGKFPPAVKSVAVKDGAIDVTWTHYADDDPNCCPSEQTTLSYLVTGNQATLVGNPVTTSAS